MLGSFRFVLATLVVMNHLWIVTANHIGAHAVIAFYAISGYLMTSIIHKDYGLSLDGAKRYAVNRFLRIYPPYAVFLFLSVAFLYFFPAQSPYSIIVWPTSTGDWLRNLFLFDLVSSKSSFIPPAWSLGVEAFFYLAMVALLSRSAKIVAVWLTASSLVHVYLISVGANFGLRYSPLYAASLFFSIGAATYFWKQQLFKLAVSPKACLLILPVFCFWPLIVQAAGFDRLMLGYYGAFPLFYVIFISILAAKTPRSGVDDYLGKLAYPIFVSHFLAAWVVHIAWPSGPRLTFGYLLVCYGVTIAMSVAFIAYVDAPIERLRDRVKSKSQRSEQRRGEPQTV